MSESPKDLPIPGGRSKALAGVVLLGASVWGACKIVQNPLWLPVVGTVIMGMLFAFAYPLDPFSWLVRLRRNNLTPTTYYFFWDESRVKWIWRPDYPVGGKKPDLGGVVVESFISHLFSGNTCSVYWGCEQKLHKRENWSLRLPLWQALREGGEDCLVVLRDPLGVRHNMSLERLFSPAVQKAIQDNSPLLDVLYHEADAHISSSSV